MFDEERRQRALDELNVLDTPPDERVDRITRLAQEIFGVPMASVNLIDRERQWSKSAMGFEAEDVPRQETFCDTTIQQPDSLVIEDLEKYAPFAQSRYVTGAPNLRFYAGHPIEAPGGERVGALCLMDTKPRELNQQDRQLLKDLALWVQTELAQQQELDHAAVIQRALHPRQLPEPTGFTVRADSRPAGGVSGDFHDALLRNGRLRVTLADVMGKGMGAGIIASAVRSSMRTVPNRTLLETVSDIDVMLQEDIGDLNMFATIFCADIDTTTGRLEYVDGGHSLSFIYRADGTWEHLHSTGLPLAMGLGESYGLSSAQLNPGDALLCCSDGVLDLLDPENPFLEVTKILAAHGVDGSVSEAMAFAERQRAPDDVTVVTVRRHA
ncbi:PP2C family protein-serine/threonine phosphatase [Nesterenkonia salmonea]|nr:GAF domain-containing SpoIIE family protein phosphatase [Nesterenkonia salmonea]